MRRSISGFTLTEMLALPIISIVLVLIAGWISNVIQIIHLAQADNLHAMFWLKLVGCLLAPLGAILGVAGWF